MSTHAIWLRGIGRRNYFIVAGLLILASAVLTSFAFAGGPAGWLLLFTARVRDTGKRIWLWPGLTIVGIEMFARPIVHYATDHISRRELGYGVIGVIAVHLVYMLLLGLQQAAPRSSPSAAETVEHFS